MRRDSKVASEIIIAMFILFYCVMFIKSSNWYDVKINRIYLDGIIYIYAQ